MDTRKPWDYVRQWFSLVVFHGGWRVPGLTALALVAAAFVGIMLHHAITLAVSGVEVQGRVTRMEVHEHRCGENHQRCVDHIVHYEFPSESGWIKDKSEVSKAFYMAQTIGGSVKVRYLESDPDVSEIQAGTYVKVLLFGLPFLGVTGVMGGSGFWIYGRVASHLIAMRDRGVRREATVSRMERIEKPKGKSAYVVHWRDEAGVYGQSLDQETGTWPGVGDKIVIYADPEGQRASVWQADLGGAA